MACGFKNSLPSKRSILRRMTHEKPYSATFDWVSEQISHINTMTWNRHMLWNGFRIRTRDCHFWDRSHFRLILELNNLRRAHSADLSLVFGFVKPGLRRRLSGRNACCTDNWMCGRYPEKSLRGRVEFGKVLLVAVFEVIAPIDPSFPLYLAFLVSPHDLSRVSLFTVHKVWCYEKRWRRGWLHCKSREICSRDEDHSPEWN